MNQGFFVGDGAKVLPYGSALAVNGYRCASAPNGVTCRVEGSQRGFTFAREGVQTTG